MSVTTTGWLSGIVVAALARPFRAALQVTANALAVVVMLWALQNVFVSTPFFLGADPDRQFFFHPMSGGPVQITRALVAHSIVMPDIRIVPEPKWGRRLSVQASQVGSSGVAGAVATALWFALFSTGFAALASGRGARVIRTAIVPTLAAQILFYNCFGEETFLYSLYVAPLLIACASAATTIASRRWILIGTWLLIALLIVNNLTELSQAARFFSVHQ